MGEETDMTILKEGSPTPQAWAFLLLILGGIGTFAGIVYSFQNGKIWEQGNLAAAQAVSISNIETRAKYTEQHVDQAIGNVDQKIDSLSSKLVDVLGGMRGLTDANTAQATATSALKDQVTGLQKQVSDLDLVLRPPRVVVNPSLNGR